MTPEETVPDPTRTTAPTRVGLADVHRLWNTTRSLRATDYRNGGGACHRAVLDQLAAGHRLLHAATTDPVRERLVAAVADLHNLAGWTSFDTGRPQRAVSHYRHGLELLGERGHPGLEANLRYRLSRVHLHRHAPNEALTELTRSREAATRAGSPRAAAIASVNLAWAHAMRGDQDAALRALGRGQEEFARVRGPVPSWEAFFDATDLAAMVGTVHTELAARGNRHRTPHAIAALATATRDYASTMRRSLVFCLVMLALDHVIEGDLDGGAGLADKAADHATGLTSARVGDRMRPLLAYARYHRRHTGLTEATERLRRLL
jgi:tetratricopeptide (TPR) repeat protein